MRKLLRVLGGTGRHRPLRVAQMGQGTGTVPLPGGPAGAGAPVFVHTPPPQPVAAPEATAPTLPSGTPPPAGTAAPVSAPKSDASATPSIPQLTSFPELTRGVGKSETLLKD